MYSDTKFVPPTILSKQYRGGLEKFLGDAIVVCLWVTCAQVKDFRYHITQESRLTIKSVFFSGQ